MNGKWICTDTSVETPMFTKNIRFDDPTRVEIDVSGLGYFILLVNGRRVTDDLFTPAPTDYAPRNTAEFGYPIHDTFTYKVLYLHYDITEFIHPGENTVSVIVGNGWFRQNERVAEGNTGYSDTLCAIFDICVTENGSERHICTDGTESCCVYPILKSNLFLGDTIDTRMFAQGLPEAPVYLYEKALGELVPQDCPPDRVIRTLTPTHLGDGIYDVGENISGRVVLNVSGKFGKRVTVYHAEELLDGELDYSTSGGGYKCQSGEEQIQRDIYILNGNEQTLCPVFAFHGFRYFKVEGKCKVNSAAVQVIHTELPVTSRFQCDNPVLNWLYSAFVRTLQNNFHGSFPSDCPHRERLGYTGDGQATALAGMLTMDSRRAYRKWITDIFDGQCSVSGHIQHTAPFGGGGGGPGGWGCAAVFVPYHYYNVYGDRELLEETYPKMEHWIDYLEAHSENGLVCREEEGGWCLGDWCAVPETVIPVDFVNTCCTTRALSIMEDIARILGRDTLRLHALAENHKQALYAKYYNGGSYFDGVQGADAYAVWAELPGDGVAESLVRRYEARDTFDTGFVGTEILCDTLFRLGRGDIAVKLMGSGNTEVGFNFMRSHDATTLYERMDTVHTSHNHHMFGGCVHTLFTGLLGIRPEGGKLLRVEPCLTSGLAHFRGGIQLPAGRIAVEVSESTVTVETDFAVTAAVNGTEYAVNTGRSVIKA